MADVTEGVPQAGPEAGDSPALQLEGQREAATPDDQPRKRPSVDDSVLEVIADDSVLDMTVGHTSEDDSAKESGAESDDGSYETVESGEGGEGALVTANQQEELPPCPMCLMLPRDHPSYLEVHNKVMLYMARLLGGARICLLVPRELENHPEDSIILDGPLFRREVFNVYFAQEAAESEVERDFGIDED